MSSVKGEIKLQSQLKSERLWYIVVHSLLLTCNLFGTDLHKKNNSEPTISFVCCYLEQKGITTLIEGLSGVMAFTAYG